MFYIGEILKTRGNNGEVVLRTSPDFSYTRSIHSIFLKSKKHERTLNIKSINEVGDDLIIKFTDIDTITDAYRLIGYSAYLEDEEINTFKKDNLVDYKIVDIAGNLWGRVINDIEEGLTHILEIEDDANVIYIPYSENIITEIKIKEKTIIIDPPDGLRTLNK